MSGRSFGFVHRILKQFHDAKGMDYHLLGDMVLKSADPGVVKLSMVLQPFHLNRIGSLHGGTIAAMTDLAGSLAVASRGLQQTGVSIDMNQTYLSAGGKTGDKIDIVSYCDKLGSNLAFTRVDFVNKRGQTFARGSHTKYVALAMKAPDNELDKYMP